MEMGIGFLAPYKPQGHGMVWNRLQTRESFSQNPARFKVSKSKVLYRFKVSKSKVL